MRPVLVWLCSLIRSATDSVRERSGFAFCFVLIFELGEICAKFLNLKISRQVLALLLHRVRK